MDSNPNLLLNTIPNELPPRNTTRQSFIFPRCKAKALLQPDISPQSFVFSESDVLRNDDVNTLECAMNAIVFRTVCCRLYTNETEVSMCIGSSRSNVGQFGNLGCLPGHSLLVLLCSRSRDPRTR